MSWDEKLARLRTQLGTQVHPPSHIEVPFEVPPFAHRNQTANVQLSNSFPGLECRRLAPRMENYIADFQFSLLKSSFAAIPPNYERKCENITQCYCIGFGRACILARKRCSQSRDHFIEDPELDEAVKTACIWYYVINTSPASPCILNSPLEVDALFLVFFLKCWHQTIARPDLSEDVHTELQKQVPYRPLEESLSGIWLYVYLCENDSLAKVWTSMRNLEDRLRENGLHIFNSQLRTLVTNRCLQLLQNFTSSDEEQMSKAFNDDRFLDCDSDCAIIFSIT